MQDSKQGIIRYVLVGFAITVVSVGITFWIEHTYWGHRVELFAIEVLQGLRSPFNPEEELPIVVVDVSDIKGGKNGQIIDLARLKEVVSAIAKQKPRAIAVDAVLIPEPEDAQNENLANEAAKQTQQYFEFLDVCQQLKNKGTPIFLGVGNRTIDKPEDWLGAGKYKELAATVLIREDTSRIPIWLKAGPNAEKLLSLSTSLASAYKTNAYKTIPLPLGLSWAIETQGELPGTQQHLQQGIESADALVNFGKLEAIRENKLLTLSETSVEESGEKFHNRMVILGDDTKAVERFVVVGRGGAIPGVYIHACAAYTFVREPLYEFKLFVRLLLDSLLSAFVICWVAIKRHQHLNERKVFDWHKLQSKLTIITAIVVFLVAVWLVWLVGVLWPDFLLVAGALWLHPKVERHISPKSKKS